MQKCKGCGHPVTKKGIFGNGKWCHRCMLESLVIDERAERRQDKREQARYRAAWMRDVVETEDR